MVHYIISVLIVYIPIKASMVCYISVFAMCTCVCTRCSPISIVHTCSQHLDRVVKNPLWRNKISFDVIKKINDHKEFTIIFSLMYFGFTLIEFLELPLLIIITMC